VFGALKQRLYRLMRIHSGMPDVDRVIKNLYIGSIPCNEDILLDDDYLLKLDIRFVEEGKQPTIQEIDDYVDMVIMSMEKTLVLVHCRRGRARSAIIVIGVLMKYFNKNLYKAIEFLRDKRPIYLNKSQMKVLREYEKCLKEC